VEAAPRSIVESAIRNHDPKVALLALGFPCSAARGRSYSQVRASRKPAAGLAGGNELVMPELI
jgi:hypothetical protein